MTGNNIGVYVMSENPMSIERRRDPVSKDDFNELENTLTSEFNRCKERVKVATLNGDRRLAAHDEEIKKLFNIAEQHETRIKANESQIALLINSNQHQHVQNDQMTGFIKSVSSALESNSSVTQSVSDRVDLIVEHSKRSGQPSAKQVVKSGGFWVALGAIGGPSIVLLIAMLWFMLSGDASLIEALK